MRTKTKTTTLLLTVALLQIGVVSVATSASVMPVVTLETDDFVTH
jgi:hypothetical protein